MYAGAPDEAAGDTVPADTDTAAGNNDDAVGVGANFLARTGWASQLFSIDALLGFKVSLFEAADISLKFAESRLSVFLYCMGKVKPDFLTLLLIVSGLQFHLLASSPGLISSSTHSLTICCHCSGVSFDVSSLWQLVL